jgi:hypothetical protein
VNADRRDQQHRRADGAGHRDEVDDPQLRTQVFEAVMERKRQQQPGEQLDTGLHHP